MMQSFAGTILAFGFVVVIVLVVSSITASCEKWDKANVYKNCLELENSDKSFCEEISK